MFGADPEVSALLLRQDDLTPANWIHFLGEASARFVEIFDDLTLETLEEFGCFKFKSDGFQTDHASLKNFEAYTKKMPAWTPEMVSMEGIFGRFEKKSRRIASAWIIGLTKDGWRELEVELSSFEKPDEFSLIMGIKSRAICMEEILEEYEHAPWSVWHLLLEASRHAAGRYARLHQQAEQVRARFEAEEKILNFFMRRHD